MATNRFKIKAPFKADGDQPQAIKQLIDGLKNHQAAQTLLGVTGSGKTFTIAHVIEAIQRPTLVMAPNKTLAAQLASEFRLFFPNNSVGYFVSYYDYYQPEAYVPSTDTYIEKETDINDEIDRLRHAATAALLSRRDVIIVASVSCIYGLGSPEEYAAQNLWLAVDNWQSREEILAKLVNIFYTRSEILKRGTFRAHGGTIEIMPPDRENILRLEIGKNGIQSIAEFDGLTRAPVRTYTETVIFPAKHFIASEDMMKRALTSIETDLDKSLKTFEKEGKLLEAERLERRTRQDLELLRQIGTCPGVENYSRYFTGRASGEAPSTLIDFFPKDFLLVVDESHVTIPQIGGMYEGDRARKQNLVDYGFRLPAALDNRPLKFSEFEAKINQAIYVSATPSRYELDHSRAAVRVANSEQQLEKEAVGDVPIRHSPFAIRSEGIIEQVVRPTGLIDPEIIIKTATNQISDVIKEIAKVTADNDRVLITTLTKKQAEQLQTHLTEKGFLAGYLHSEVDTLERIKTLEKLRRGNIDILVGVNLLREGLDLPEVALVAILDADKEGFLRSETSLIQTMGRAARNIRGRVILYADRTTGSMERAIAEAKRRRQIQVQYNVDHKITPRSIEKAIKTIIDHELKPIRGTDALKIIDAAEIPELMRTKEREMKAFAKALKFEEATLLRDEINELKQMMRNDSLAMDR